MTYSKVSDTTFAKSEQVEIVYNRDEVKAEIEAQQVHLNNLQGHIAVTEAKIAQLQALLAEGEKVGVVEKTKEEENGTEGLDVGTV